MRDWRNHTGDNEFPGYPHPRRDVNRHRALTLVSFTVALADLDAGMLDTVDSASIKLATLVTTEGLTLVLQSVSAAPDNTPHAALGMYTRFTLSASA